MEYEPKYECLLFDVDDTLYPLSSGISAQVTKNIIEYMINKLSIEEEKAPEMAIQLYREYGTTMAGLRAIGYDFDYDEYHSFVHGRLPYEWLKTDHTLRTLLRSLPVRKVIFSNGNEAHVAKILSRLGLEDCFDDIICFETLNPSSYNKNNNTIVAVPENGFDADMSKIPIVCKPFENAFEQAFQFAQINSHKTVFFDDSIRNIQTAGIIGLKTVWVGSSHRSKGVDYALESIHNIKEVLPELWETTAEKEKIDVCCSEKLSIETYVRA